MAGGLGTRLSEETSLRPKPMVEVGGYPVLWHIMKSYAAYGIDDFVVCCGYKQEVIKEWFATYTLRTSDVTFDLGAGTMLTHRARTEKWRVTLIDTGLNSMTGGRLRRVADQLDDTFCFTYGDGVADVRIDELISFHRSHGRLATMTAVQPPGRFGSLVLHGNDTSVTHFQEKPDGDGAWINGGYFVLEPEVIDYIAGDGTTWEQEPLRNLAHDGQLHAFRHPGFWQPMDTVRDRDLLERHWQRGTAPWKVWDDA